MKKFEPWEDQILQECGDALSAEQLGSLLGWSSSAIRTRLKLLGVTMDPRIRAYHIRGNQFRKGMTPINKGQKMPESVRQKVAHTWYKKGNIPLNTIGKTDGDLSLRIDKRGVYNWFYRKSLGKWIAFNRIVWEWYNGPIPPKHCIIHLDGDSKNCAPRNLDCISQRQNRIRNSDAIMLSDHYVARMIAGKHQRDLVPELINYPELLEVKRKSIQLNRIIKNGSQ